MHAAWREWMVVLRFKIILDMQSKFAFDIFKIWSKIISAIIQMCIHTDINYFCVLCNFIQRIETLIIIFDMC